jgi:hypothetical protein
MPPRMTHTESARIDRVFGDPGVVGLLSDPLAPAWPHDAPDPGAGPPDPDTPPPRHHGDWSPTRRGHGAKSRSAPHPLVGRRRSKSGMPKALFREGDGISLDDLRALGRMSGRS